MDVRCKDSRNQQFIIEMQLVQHAGFNQRALMYAARAYAQQLKKGMSFKDVPPVYLLSIVHHQIKPDAHKWLHQLSVIDKTDPTFEITGNHLVFLELAKRKKWGNFNFNDPIDSWLSFLAEPEKILNMTKFDLSVYPNLMKAVELLDESNYTQAQLDAYDRHLMAVYDINRSRIESYDEGYDKGVIDGETRGKLSGVLEGVDLSIAIMKDLKEGRLSFEQIAVQYSVSIELVLKLSGEFLG